MESLSVGRRTDVGRARKMNQDNLTVLTAAELGGLADGLYVVADGMGGRAGGEIASRVTIETVPIVVKEALTSGGNARDAVHDALMAANEAVYGQAKANPELRGMGTTCVAVLVRGDEAVVGNIGDSRVYLLRGGGFTALTHDHSLVAQHLQAGELTEEEARASRYRNIITRAIGIAEAVEPDIEAITLQQGDTLLLCTDGLTNMLTDTEIARILARGDDPTTTCDHLISCSNAAGGADNITVVVARYGSFVPVEIPAEEADTQREAYPGRVVSSLPVKKPMWRYIQIPLLFAVVAAAWLLLARYELHMEPPYLRPRKTDPQPVLVRPAAPKLIDLSKIKNSERPKLLHNRGLRDGFLDVTPGGSAVVVSEDGKILRLGAGAGAEEYPILKLRGENDILAIDPVGNIFVFNKSEKAITKHNRSGTRIDVIGKGRLVNPSAVAVNAKGDVYVLDSGRLVMFEAIAESGAGAKRDAPR